MRAMVDSAAMYFGEILRRSSLQPPSKLNEAMLFTSNGSWLRPPVLPSDRPVSRSHSTNRMHCFFIFIQMHEANWFDLGVWRVVTACEGADERGPHSPGNVAGPFCPILEPAQRGIPEDFSAANFRTDVQQLTNLHKQPRPQKSVPAD